MNLKTVEREKNKLIEAHKKDLKNRIRALNKQHKAHIGSNPYTKIKGKKFISLSSKWSLKYWREWTIWKFAPHKSIMINLELETGGIKRFPVKENAGLFYFEDRAYIVDGTHKEYCFDERMYVLHYHQRCSIPIKQKIPIDEVIDVSKSIDKDNVENLIESKNLHSVAVAELGRNLGKASKLDQRLKMISLLTIMSLLVSVGTLAFLLIKTNALNTGALGI